MLKNHNLKQSTFSKVKYFKKFLKKSSRKALFFSRYNISKLRSHLRQFSKMQKLSSKHLF